MDHDVAMAYWHDMARTQLWWHNGDGTWMKKEAAGGPWGDHTGRSVAAADVDPWVKSFDASDAPVHRWWRGGQTNLCYCELDASLLAGRDGTCFVDEATRCKVDRRTLLCLAHAGAAWLRARGWRLVGLWVQNNIRGVAWVEACKRAGVVYVPLSDDSSPASVQRRCADACVDVLLTDLGPGVSRSSTILMPVETLPELQGDLAATLLQESAAWSGAELVAACAGSLVPVDANHPAFVMYTSGSTGKPKGIVHTHAGLGVGAMATGAEVLALTPDDVLLVVATPGWITGQVYGICAALLHGCTSVLALGSAVTPPTRVSDLIAAHKVTVVKAASTYVRVLQAMGPTAIGDTSSLRLGAFCAEPVHADTQAFATRHLCARYINCYWSTEHGAIVCAPLVSATDWRADGSTHPLPWLRCDVEDGVLRLAGVRPPHMGRTVWRHPGPASWALATGDVARWGNYFDVQGRYVQGDAARWSDEGGGTARLFLLGRADDVVNVGGNRLAVQQVDDAICADDGVVHSATVGVDDPLLGTALWSFVEPRSLAASTEHDELGMRRRVAETVGRAAVPREILSMSPLPMTLTGKLLRTVLRAAIADQPCDASTARDPRSVVLARYAARLVPRNMHGPPPSLEPQSATVSLDMARLRALGEGHEVCGRTIAPAALMLECLRATTQSVCVHDLRLHAPLYLDGNDGEQVVQAHKETTEDGLLHVRFVQGGRTLCEATVSHEKKDTTAPAGEGDDTAAEEEEEPTGWSADEFYGTLRRKGLAYGGHYVCLTAPSHLLATDAAPLHHPRGIDALFQRQIAASHPEEVDTTYVPVHVRHAWLASYEADKPAARLRLRADGGGDVCDRDARVLAQLRGVTYARFAHAADAVSSSRSHDPPKDDLGEAELQTLLRRAVAKALRRGDVGLDEVLDGAGIDSFGALTVFEAARAAVPRPERATATLVYDHPTVRRMTRHLLSQDEVSEVSASAKVATSEPAKFKVLCLHGNRSNADELRLQLRSLQERLPGGEFDFLEGDVRTPVTSGRAWYHSSDGDEVRYHGVETAMERIRQKMHADGPYEVVLGFSQGACLLTMLAHAYAKQSAIAPWRLLLLVAPVDPIDPRWQVPVASLTDPCIMVLGDADAEHLPRGLATRRLFANVRVYRHPGGHTVPSDGALMETLRKDVLDRVGNELWYYNWRGRAELVRLALAECNVAYRNVVPDDETPADRARFLERARLLGGHPTTNIPLLRLEDQVYTQTHAIVRHLQRTYLPNLGAHAYRIDMLLDAAADLRDRILRVVLPLVVAPGSEAHPNDILLTRRAVTRHVQFFKKELKEGPFLLGFQFCIADLAWYDALYNFVERVFPGTLGADVMQFVYAIQTRPRIAAWLASSESAQLREFPVLARDGDGDLELS